jgi:hypothetical protein
MGETQVVNSISDWLNANITPGLYILYLYFTGHLSNPAVRQGKVKKPTSAVGFSFLGLYLLHKLLSELGQHLL